MPPKPANGPRHQESRAKLCHQSLCTSPSLRKVKSPTRTTLRPDKVGGEAVQATVIGAEAMDHHVFAMSGHHLYAACKQEPSIVALPLGGKRQCQVPSIVALPLGGPQTAGEAIKVRTAIGTRPPGETRVRRAKSWSSNWRLSCVASR